MLLNLERINIRVSRVYAKNVKYAKNMQNMFAYL